MRPSRHTSRACQIPPSFPAGPAPSANKHLAVAHADHRPLVLAQASIHTPPRPKKTTWPETISRIRGYAAEGASSVLSKSRHPPKMAPRWPRHAKVLETFKTRGSAASTLRIAPNISPTLPANGANMSNCLRHCPESGGRKIVLCPVHPPQSPSNDRKQQDRHIPKNPDFGGHKIVFCPRHPPNMSLTVHKHAKLLETFSKYGVRLPENV